MEESNRSGTGNGSPSCWSASTNWIVADGSLHDSICFDSSSSILEGADDGVAITRDLLLLKPPSQDSVPCEVTVCFREKHDIHKVYVRSTARVYEIYYASEQKNGNNEYLCTVHCGAAAKESLLPASVATKTVIECQKCSDETKEVSEQMAKGDNNNNSSDEDSWVEVKVHDCSLIDDGTNTLITKNDRTTDPNLEKYYEATAEISDASPSISVTLRLLSLQTQGCVYVEEIYIYTDPVKSTDSGTPEDSGGNLAGSSMLSMLVPSFLELSKTGVSSRFPERHVSDNSFNQKLVEDTEEMSEKSNLEIEMAMPSEACFRSAYPSKGQAQSPREGKSIKTQVDSSQEIPGADQIPKPTYEETNVACNRIEGVLDELVSRMGRIEAFCSRFEDNMLKPLNCIETRLQRLEQQLDTLNVRTQSSETFLCSKVSTPKLSSDEFDSGNNDIDFPDAARDVANLGSPLPMADSHNNLTDRVLASKVFPGLEVKAPGFSNEDNAISRNGSSDSADDNSDLAGNSCPKDKASLSSSQIASALDMFLDSNSAKYFKFSLNMVSTPEFSNVGDDELLKSPIWVQGEITGNSGFDFQVTNGEHAVDFTPTSCISSPKDSKEHHVNHQKWLGEAHFKEISLENQFHMKCVRDALLNETVDDCGDKDENDDSDSEESYCRAPNLNPICQLWGEDSSSDSSTDARIILGYDTNWTDESSNGSISDSFTLSKWLHGQKDDQSYRETNVKETKSNIPQIVSMASQSKSKVELDRALNSAVDYELPLLDVKFTSERTWKSGSPLEVLLGKMADSSMQASCEKDSQKDIGTEEESNSFPMPGEEFKAHIIAQEFLVDLEDCRDEVLQYSSGSRNWQPFMNLI